MPQYLKEELFDEIRTVLSNQFLDRDESISLAKNSGLDPATIEFSHTAKKNWDAILSRAEEKSKVPDLLNIASESQGGVPAIIVLLKKLTAEDAWDVNLQLDGIVKSLTRSKGKPPVMLMVFAEGDGDDYTELLQQFALVDESELVIRSFRDDIKAGNIKLQQEQLVNEADLIVPLITPLFFNREYGYLSYIRSAIDTDKLLIPALFKNCLYGRVKVLKDYLTLPPLGMFVDEYSNRELACKEIAEGILKVVDDLNSK